MTWMPNVGFLRRYSGSTSGLSPESYRSQSHHILQNSGLQHHFKNWQNLRKHKLTASTFALAVGFWPRGRTKLWLEKIGTNEPFSGNLATCWSNINEEEALKRYIQMYEDYGNRLLFISKPEFQGLMEILDRDWMDMYCYTVNGSSLFRLYRNQEYWKILKIALSDFWWNHVQAAKEIISTRVITNPLTELSCLRPTPKHELHQCIVHASKLLFYGEFKTKI
ncbi:hypothetical protein MIMGU_mgv1a022438mg [Erythranthe guttata]|uniref:YqaJ viral recombinase domain-containing protein n=1 Tax=Erythranthe guttata TaxID=4155 RepID=A0A022PZT5_ERYGU|nr:hypothetical protein MIMGU_mgv1a022438mg [Erythranthe guttata]